MDDSISRQAAIKGLREMAFALYGYDATSVIGCAIIKLQNLPSAQRWIPVSERLPEEAYGCLVTVHVDNPFSGEYDTIYNEIVGWDGDGWNDSDGWTLPYEVVAWMPLPEPPRDGE